MPSHWQVEAQLMVLRRRYSESSLKWAHRMIEFQNWCTSDTLSDCRERILWIVGAPGVGKSTLAAYLVEFTRSIDKDAILAYFFVRRESNGLTKPSDILRTLAYQCSLMDTKVRDALDTLKTNGFRIDDNLGMDLLVRKLLVEPLSESTKPRYIILDGLEEADKTMDVVDNRKQGIEILIEHLCNLPSTRLLILCRPQSIPPKVKNRSTFRSIGYNDNKDDIEAYVRRQLVDHQSLRKRFAKEGIEPVQFFLNNSNGIFLWVVLLLEQLSKASRTIFQKYVRDVAQAPSDMTQLYINILQHLNPEQRQWVREILPWILAPRRQLTVKELQSAVEWCLDDELDSFEEFLRLQCGSIFIVAGMSAKEETVQIVHETLRAFLEDPELCPSDLHVTTDSVHKHLVASGLQILMAKNTEDEPIFEYLAENWNYHLINVKRSEDDHGILYHLHGFFHSHNFERWLHHQLVVGWNNEDRLKAETDIEDKVIRDVRDWLLRCRVVEGGEAQNAVSAEVILWADDMLQNPSKLGEHIGKASARIWLFEELPSLKARTAAFELATRHYWRCQIKTKHSNRDALEGLIKTHFRSMLLWIEDTGSQRIIDKNLDVARRTLQQWDENLAFKSMITKQDELSLWENIRLLHTAVTQGHQLDTTSPAVSQSEGPLAGSRSKIMHADDLKERATVSLSNSEELASLWVTVGDAYRAIAIYDEALAAYQTALEKKPRDIGLYENIADVYRVTGNHDKAIQTFEIVVQQFPDADTWCSLGRQYRAGRNEEKAVTR